MTDTADKHVIKNKYLRNLAKIFDVTHMGPAFWGAQAYYLKNKDDEDSKVVYAFELENGSKLELVDIYNGSLSRISSFSTLSCTISSATPYQRDMILNSIFACFVKSVEYDGKNEIIYTRHKGRNIVEPKKNALFEFGEFELQVFTNRVEIMLPNCPTRIIGMYKKLPMVDAPTIDWSFDTTRRGFLEESDLY